jgi:peptidyl-prolyl cis-trans isomerase A (cyclophilin A)
MWIRQLATAVWVVLGCCAAYAGQPKNPRVLLQTDLGNIVVEIYQNEAPTTARNFLRYVREDRFRGAVFYRVVREDNQSRNKVKIAVIQGGLGDEIPGQTLPPIPLETTAMTGIKHKDGTLSMARAEPDSATSEFFICVGEQPELDYGGRRNPDGQGFAAFGRVIEGMDVVRKIYAQPLDDQQLNPLIKIKAVKSVHEGRRLR